MTGFLDNLIGNVQLPEVQTDIGKDLDYVIQKHKPGLVIGVFAATVLAIVVAHFITKKI